MGASGVPTNDPILIGISGLSLRLLKLPSRFTSYWFNTGSVWYYYQADEPPFVWSFKQIWVFKNSGVGTKGVQYISRD